MNSTMAKLHPVDPMNGPRNFWKTRELCGKTSFYWTKQYQDSETEEIPEMNKTNRMVSENLPSDKPLRIVHGDFSLTNLCR
ncbi:MAG: hypothetical protein Ct9H90mP4_08830 [Gammaproteobacteria bacterium]|nr:MAG: hypothetical protein Ct9H90mP4_08830 [Gammaproteobacteria bacterium]